MKQVSRNGHQLMFQGPDSQTQIISLVL